MVSINCLLISESLHNWMFTLSILAQGEWYDLLQNNELKNKTSLILL